MEERKHEARTLAELVEDARSRIVRLSPAEAAQAAAEGALLIDIRSDGARARDGVVPGALHIPRTVLEWRVAPDSAWRSPQVGGPDRRLVLLCDHGHSSTLAAAVLCELGFEGCGDVIGGFEAWRAAGLPVSEAPPGDPDLLPGMGPPDP